MEVRKTLMFITSGWFLYGQGDDLVGCYADGICVGDYESAEKFRKVYPKCFDMDDEIAANKIVDTEKYCVCYDDSEDDGQKSFSGTGDKIKTKLLNLYHKDRVSAAWIFPMSKAIKTKDLEKEIRSDHKKYAKVAEWIDDNNW